MAVLYHPYTDPSRVYYGTDTRVATLLLGAALAFVWAPWRLVGRHRAQRAASLLDAVAVVSGIVARSGCSSTSASSTRACTAAGSSLVAIVSALLIAATVHPASQLVPWLLGLAVFRWIGVRSYGIYLWHWPIYMVTRPHSDVPLTGLPLLVLRLALTFLAAARCRTGTSRSRSATARSSAGGREFRTAPAETQRQLDDRASRSAPAGIVVGLVIIVVGLGNGGSAAAPAGFGKRSRGGRAARATTTTTAARRRRPPTPTTAPHRRRRRPPPGAPAAHGDRHRRLGDARRRQPADADHRHDVRNRRRHRRRRRGEPAVLRRRRPASRQLQGHGPARAGRRRAARHQRHRRPRRLRPHDGRC